MRRIAVIVVVLALSACATLVQEMDPPTINLQTVKPIRGDAVAPDFEITLRVVNPNKIALNIVGIAYDIEVMGRELVSGVSNDIPRIAPYSEQVVKLTASVNVYQLLRLMADVSTRQAKELDYQLNAKIDFDGLVPTQRMQESGVIDLATRN